MKIFDKLKAIAKKTPKGVSGVGLILLGAAVELIPVVGPIASPYIMGSGVVLITGSAVDKSIRAFKKEDAFSKEKSLVTKVTTMFKKGE